MGDNPALSDNQKAIPNDSLPSQRESEVESSAISQDLRASTPKPPIVPEKKEETRGDIVRTGEVERLRGEVEDLIRRVGKQDAEILWFKEENEYLTGKYQRRDGLIAKLKDDILKMRAASHEAAEVHAQQVRAIQERLKQKEELLEARSAELSGAQAFLSTADRLSEMEVLDIVRDLNENIYQVAVSLTEGWEKLQPPPPQVTDRMDANHTSQTRIPILVQLARKHDFTGLTFLLQSCLCSQAVSMTSRWDNHRELELLKYVYKHVSASEGQAISARWRSLTHSHLSLQPPDSALLVELLARVLNETGSFPSTKQSLEFVQEVALERIESMIRIAQRLETTFMVDVTSSDMSLLVEDLDTVFDAARMTDEFGSDGPSVPKKQDRVAGTTEVGVMKSVCGRPGENRRGEILLKPKVVLEKDAVGDGE